MNLEELYKKIIPPNNYQDRKDFYNDSIIDSLNEDQKKLIEEMLIEELKLKFDLLVIETLAYLKSKKSINVIENHLKESKDTFNNIIIAWSLYSLGDKKDKMIDIAYNNFLEVNDNYSKTYLFYYLAKFKSDKIDSLIKSHINDSDFLVSYSAKQALSNKGNE